MRQSQRLVNPPVGVLIVIDPTLVRVTSGGLCVELSRPTPYTITRAADQERTVGQAPDTDLTGPSRTIGGRLDFVHDREHAGY